MKSIPVKGKAKFDVKKDSADLNFKHGSKLNLEKERALQRSLSTVDSFSGRSMYAQKNY